MNLKQNEAQSARAQSTHKQHEDQHEDIPLVEFMYLVFTHIQMRVPVGDSGLCCCTCFYVFGALIASLAFCLLWIVCIHVCVVLQ